MYGNEYVGVENPEYMDQNFMAFFIAFLFIGLTLYVVNAIALQRISEEVGYDKGWLAWIPIANSFLIVILVENDVHKELRGKFTLIYAGFFILGLFLPFVNIVTLIMSYYAFFIIAKWYSEKYVAHFVISIVTFGISMPFQLLSFAMRERQPKRLNDNKQAEDIQSL